MNPIEIQDDIRALEATGVTFHGNPSLPSSALLGDGTELYRRTMTQDYGDSERAALMEKVWTPTPWMIDVVTEGREQEIWHWCYHTFGPESSPIHKKVGNWRRSCVTMRGRTWFGFKTKALMERFEAEFPSPNVGSRLSQPKEHKNE